MNKLPPKLKDPSSFTIPCAIGNVKLNQALCDLGANVSLMSKSSFDRISVGELIQMKITLRLANRSTKSLLGMVENLLLQVSKFYMSIDFVMIEIGNEVVIFDVLRMLKYSSNESNICKISIEQEMVDKELKKLTLGDPLWRLIAYPTDK
jgi:Aspartyl protease